jgi:hypothetical protein
MSILAFLLILRFGRNKSLFQKLKSFGLSISTNEPKLEISKYLVVFGITLGLLIALPSKVNPLFYLVSNHPEFFGIFREPWSKLYFYALLILLLPIWIKIDKLAWALDEYQASISTEIALSENRKQRQTLLFNSRKNVFRKLIVIRLAVILSLAPLIHFTVWNLTRPSQNLPPYVQTIKERQNFLFEVLNAAEILNTGKGYVVCIENSQASWYVAIESLISNALGSSKSDFRSSPAYNSFTRCDDLQEVEEIAMVNCKEQKSFVGVYLSARSELCFTSESIIRANTALLSEATQINGKLYSKRK